MADDVPLVPQYRDLIVYGGRPKFDDLAGEVERRLEAPWSRDHEMERSERLLPGGSYRVFNRAETEASPGLNLFLIADDDDVEVANVVPTGGRDELTREEYNDSVAEFHGRFLADAASTLALEVRIGATDLDLSDVLDEATFRALLAFSRASNKATGSSHPSDRERWFAFILGVHGSRPELSTGDLQSWLVLDGWSEDVVFDLISEFEFAVGLLNYAARH